jgi:uncharacterized membrane protein
MYLIVIGLILGLFSMFLMNYNYSAIGFLFFAIGVVMMNRGFKTHRKK